VVENLSADERMPTSLEPGGGMRLFGQDGVSFDLAIDGYQFPDITDERESNWLFVRGEVRYSGGGWAFREPCLETFELRKLADWLDSVARGRPNAETCSFMEPHLAFEYRPTPEPAVLVLFTHRCAPTWHASDERIREFALTFDVGLNDFSTAAGVLRAFLATFPERSEAEPDTLITH
jgi:hypothetical protein